VRVGTVLERFAVAVALCAVAVAVSVAALTTPWFTRVVGGSDTTAASGLSRSGAITTAEQVRLFVTDRDAPPLPAEVGGREGFDAQAVSHLVDVREVLLRARTAGIVLALALLVWFGVSLRRRRWGSIGSALRWGGLACLIAPPLLAVVGVADFERLFTAFHGVFFKAGTWVFPADSLLIQLFPERFWALSGISLALLVALQGVVLMLLGRGVGRRAEAAENGSESPRA